MGKQTTENLVKVLDALVTTPHWRKAMAVIRASEALAFHWRSECIKAMRENDTSSIWWLEFRGTWDWWSNHAGRARTENVILHEAAVRDQSLNGIEEPVFGPDQKPVWKEKPEYIGKSDDYIRSAEGLGDWEEVDRLERDAQGNPIQLTKHTQIPAPLRLAILRQDKRYIEQTSIDVHHSGEVITASPLQRLPGEARPDTARLRALAAMTPEERRKELGASKVPLDAHGRRTMPPTGLPSGRDDNLPVITKPTPAPYTPPQAPEPQEPARPSYARPTKRLDKGEEIGDGRDVPSGGFKVA
jgi:hypothetical protein